MPHTSRICFSPPAPDPPVWQRLVPGQEFGKRSALWGDRSHGDVSLAVDLSPSYPVRHLTLGEGDRSPSPSDPPMHEYESEASGVPSDCASSCSHLSDEPGDKATSDRHTAAPDNSDTVRPDIDAGIISTDVCINEALPQGGVGAPATPQPKRLRACSGTSTNDRESHSTIDHDGGNRRSKLAPNRSLEMRAVSQSGEPLPCMTDDAVPLARIPKPSGQVTRIKRGGYTLISALGWDSELYKRVQLLVQTLAEDLLDTDKPFTKQSEVKIDRVCELACEKEGLLRNYQDTWPVRDFLRTFLQKAPKKNNKHH